MRSAINLRLFIGVAGALVLSSVPLAVSAQVRLAQLAAAGIGSAIQNGAGAAAFGALGERSLTWTAGVDSTGATDSTDGIANAISAAVSGGYGLYVPCGTYKVSNITINSAVSLRGASQKCVTITGSSATSDVITISGNAPHITDLTIDRNVTATAGAGLDSLTGAFPTIERVTSQNQWQGFYLGATAGAWCNYCTALNNYSDGFYFTDTSGNVSMQWQIFWALSEFNNGWGYHTQANGGGGFDTAQTFNVAGSYANTLGGFDFDGIPTAAINDLICINCYSSFDGGNGFEFARPGANNQFTNVFAEAEGRAGTGRAQAAPPSNAGNGFNVDTGGTPYSSIAVNGGYFAQNSNAGFQIASNSAIRHVQVTNVKSWGNGYGGSNRSGFALSSASAISLLSNVIASDDGQSKQAYGIYFSNGAQFNTYLSAGYITGTANGCNAALTNKASSFGPGC